MKRANFVGAVRKPQRSGIKNNLWIYRKRMGYSQKVVARLLGHKSLAHISDYERGKRLPGLETALKLEIILRVPVAFLYQSHYTELKRKIRETEKAIQSHL